MYDDVVFIDAPNGTNTGLGLLKATRYSNIFLESQYENGAEGPLFKYELIYHATSSTNGQPESLKRSPNAVVVTPITDLGDSKEAYRLNFILRNNRDRDDYSQLIALAKAFTKNGDELDAATRKVRTG